MARLIEVLKLWTESDNFLVWVQIIISLIGVFIAVFAATWFASRQNKQVLAQNLKIETYKDLWKSLVRVNETLITFAATANLQLDFLETHMKQPPNFGESQPDYDFRRRGEINEYSKKFDDSIDDIRKAMLEFHQLWEQHEPMMSELTVAFESYKSEFDKVLDKTMFPSELRAYLGLENFEKSKPLLAQENQELIDEFIQQYAYGLDLGRMIQEAFIVDYFPKHQSIPRATKAEAGKELTKSGIRPVQITQKK